MTEDFTGGPDTFGPEYRAAVLMSRFTAPPPQVAPGAGIHLPSYLMGRVAGLQAGVEVAAQMTRSALDGMTEGAKQIGHDSIRQAWRRGLAAGFIFAGVGLFAWNLLVAIARHGFGL